MKEPLLSHLDKAGRARMVDVTAKLPTARLARAEAVVILGRTLAARLRRTGALAKGNVLETARLAGIQGAKQTANLIPLCHPLPLDVVEVHATIVGDRVLIETMARARAATGVEMEALTAASVAALTVYDMCKAASKDIVIGPIRLLEKSGGRSGHFLRKGASASGQNFGHVWAADPSPAGCVAPQLHTLSMRLRRALPSGRLVHRNMTALLTGGTSRVRKG
jgi:cyclic pyranopterin phosphate synthase